MFIIIFILSFLNITSFTLSRKKKCLVIFLLCFLEPGKSPSKHIGQNQSASLLLSFVAGVEAPVMVNNRRYGNVYMSVRLPQCLGCLEEPTQS